MVRSLIQRQNSPKCVFWPRMADRWAHWVIAGKRYRPGREAKWRSNSRSTAAEPNQKLAYAKYSSMYIQAETVFGVDAVPWRDGRLPRPKLVLCSVVTACALTAFSEFILSAYAVSGPLKNIPQATVPPLKCYTFTWEAQKQINDRGSSEYCEV
jgi:hypothetical protein